jgi:hypothetical protein
LIPPIHIEFDVLPLDVIAGVSNNTEFLKNLKFADVVRDNE